MAHKSILGFKALFLGITDGKTQILLDFALLGEKGKNGNFGMSQKDLGTRFSKECPNDCPVQERMDEYTQSKISLTIAMINTAIKKKIKSRILADSWFACSEIVKFVRSRHVICDYWGMIKIGEKRKDQISL